MPVAYTFKLDSVVNSHTEQTDVQQIHVFECVRARVCAYVYVYVCVCCGLMGEYRVSRLHIFSVSFSLIINTAFLHLILISLNLTICLI